MQQSDRERILVEVQQRVLGHWGRDPKKAEQILFDTIFFEKQRLEKESNQQKASKELRFYQDIYQEALNGSPNRHKQLLGKVTKHFSSEVLGYFNPNVYKVATKAIPPGLSLLLNSVSPLRLVESLQGHGSLADQLEILGHTPALKKLANLGTVVLVPTHISNLDSILIGFGLYKLGLPPFTYGAGLNLFSNKLLGFFMNNLGAYKVDRKKKAALYKEVLKTYAGCSMELGYHNLFFPGGTRIRCGSVERKLKMGLLGMGLDAYMHNLKKSKDKPDVFVVPCTLNYQLVLEAETLIDDHLKEVGKSRYIIEDDEFSKPKRIFDFMNRLFSLHSKIQWVIGEPMDVFGNRVNDEGDSLDRRGRLIDRRKYVEVDGAPTQVPDRDAEYVKGLADKICESYVKETVLNSSNLVAFTVFQLLLRKNTHLDLYRLLRTGGDEQSFALTEIYKELDAWIKMARRLDAQGKVRLDHGLKTKDPVAILSDALAHLGTYHESPALERQGDRLFHLNRPLLLYYQNRVSSLGLFNQKGGSHVVH